MVSVEVQGLAQLERNLIAMGQKLGLKAIRSALGAGANIIKKEATTLAPSLSGRLRRALYVKRLPKPNPYSEKYILSVRHGKKLQKRDLDAYYWGWIEFGHLTRPSHGRISSGEGSKLKKIAPQHFLIPAFVHKKIEALDKIKAVLIKKIQEFSKEKA